VFEARDRNRDLGQIAFLTVGVHVHKSARLLKWQPAQEQIVDQSKNRRVQSDSDCECQHSEESESWRFEKLPNGKADVSHRETGQDLQDRLGHLKTVENTHRVRN
jgi:hypothetical protein